ncbi:MAG: exopolysaccharide biosynthesis polyprenyl glycosylphosphotransferase [Blautia sp.]|nr:exopolysaccharide biosynthesis polyprenyl glycosylphosphotransferase [Blautia sp.]
MSSRFRHDLLLRMVKVGDVLLVAIPFCACWHYYYNRMLNLPFSDRGQILVDFIYITLFAVFGRTYEAFHISGNRVQEIFYSQSLSIFFSDLLMYLVLILLTRDMPEMEPMLLVFAIQEGLALAWSWLSNKWYYWVFPRRRSAIIYDVRLGMEELIHQYGLARKFDVTVAADAQSCIRDISMLEEAEVVFLSGIHSHDRNIILKYCILHDIDVYVIPRIGDTLMDSARQVHMFHLPMLRVRRYNPTPEFVLVKRLFDIVSAALLLILTCPLFLVTAAAIKMEDGGPVFYRQRRLTKDGREFDIIKFRSMRVDAEKNGEARLSTGLNDDRITRVGSFIRKLRIDELPQLLNILSGSMSVVGPRPERPEIAAQYEAQMPEFRLRLQGKAGLTGYAQVYGKYNTQPYDKLQMDLMYFAHPSLLEDMRIIFATIKILFLPESTEGIKDGQTTAMESEKSVDEMKSKRE